jgi:hypothetical protein
MEVVGFIEKSDYLEFYKEQYLGRNLPYAIMVVVFVSLFPLSFKDVEVGIPFYVTFVLIVSGLFYWIYLHPYVQAIQHLNVLEAENRLAKGRIVATVSDESFKIEYRNKDDLEFNWEAIYTITTTLNHYGIYTKDNGFVLIPRKAFKNGAEASNFYALVASHIIKTIPVTPKVTPMSAYVFALFSFTPWLGFVIGPIAILYGALKHKSKLIIILGVLGVLMNMVIAIVYD